MTEPISVPAPPPADDVAAPAPRRRRVLRPVLRVIGWMTLAIVCFALAFWSVLAVLFTDLSGGKSPRYIAAALVAVIQVTCLFLFRPARFRPAAFAFSVVLIVAW